MTPTPLQMQIDHLTTKLKTILHIKIQGSKRRSIYVRRVDSCMTDLSIQIRDNISSMNEATEQVDQMIHYMTKKLDLRNNDERLYVQFTGQDLPNELTQPTATESGIKILFTHQPTQPWLVACVGIVNDISQETEYLYPDSYPNYQALLRKMKKNTIVFAIRPLQVGENQPSYYQKAINSEGLRLHDRSLYHEQIFYTIKDDAETLHTIGYFNTGLYKTSSSAIGKDSISSNALFSIFRFSKICHPSMAIETSTLELPTFNDGGKNYSVVKGHTCQTYAIKVRELLNIDLQSR